MPAYLRGDAFDGALVGDVCRQWRLRSGVNLESFVLNYISANGLEDDDADDCGVDPDNVSRRL